MASMASKMAHDRPAAEEQSAAKKPRVEAPKRRSDDPAVQALMQGAVEELQRAVTNSDLETALKKLADKARSGQLLPGDVAVGRDAAFGVLHAPVSKEGKEDAGVVKASLDFILLGLEDDFGAVPRAMAALTALVLKYGSIKDEAEAANAAPAVMEVVEVRSYGSGLKALGAQVVRALADARNTTSARVGVVVEAVCLAAAVAGSSLMGPAASKALAALLDQHTLMTGGPAPASVVSSCIGMLQRGAHATAHGLSTSLHRACARALFASALHPYMQDPSGLAKVRPYGIKELLPLPAQLLDDAAAAAEESKLPPGDVPGKGVDGKRLQLPQQLILLLESLGGQYDPLERIVKPGKGSALERLLKAQVQKSEDLAKAFEGLHLEEEKVAPAAEPKAEELSVFLGPLKFAQGSARARKDVIMYQELMAAAKPEFAKLSALAEACSYLGLELHFTNDPAAVNNKFMALTAGEAVVQAVQHLMVPFDETMPMAFMVRLQKLREMAEEIGVAEEAVRLLQEEHLHKKAGNAHLPLTSAVDPEDLKIACTTAVAVALQLAQVVGEPLDRLLASWPLVAVLGVAVLNAAGNAVVDNLALLEEAGCAVGMGEGEVEQALTACAQPLRLVAVGVPSGQNEGKLLVATACLPAAVRAMRTRLAAPADSIKSQAIRRGMLDRLELPQEGDLSTKEVEATGMHVMQLAAGELHQLVRECVDPTLRLLADTMRSHGIYLEALKSLAVARHLSRMLRVSCGAGRLMSLALVGEKLADIGVMLVDDSPTACRFWKAVQDTFLPLLSMATLVFQHTHLVGDWGARAVDMIEGEQRRLHDACGRRIAVQQTAMQTAIQTTRMVSRLLGITPEPEAEPARAGQAQAGPPAAGAATADPRPTEELAGWLMSPQAAFGDPLAMRRAASELVRRAMAGQHEALLMTNGMASRTWSPS